MSRHDVAAVVVRKLVDRPQYPSSREWNQAHRAGATCAREMAYWRLHPGLALPEDPDLAILLEHGRWLEKEALHQLAEAGYEVTETDRPFEDRKLQLRGKIDGKIRLSGQKHPLEVKGYAPASWERLNSIDDFLSSDREYLRKVPGQLLSYVLLDGAGSGEAVLYLVNKVTGRPKSIVMRLEGDVLEWGERLLKKIELVNRHVAAGTLPDRIPYEEPVCGPCPFRGACLESVPGGTGPVVLDPEKAKEMLDLLEERAQLKDAHKKFEEVDEEIGGLVRGIPRLIVGDWVVTGIEVSQERVDSKRIPEKTRKRYSKTVTYWRKTVARIAPAPGAPPAPAPAAAEGGK